MTTKEQERKALDQIEKILSTLDADGWVNIAFNGAVQNARENIENDFGLSDHDSLEEARKAIAKLSSDNDVLNKQIHELEELTDWYKTQVIPTNILEDVAAMLEQRKHQLEDNISECNETIIHFADTPEDIAFRDAVKNRRQYQKLLADTQSAIEQIVARF